MSPKPAPKWSRSEPFLKNPDSWLDILLLDHVEVHIVRGLARTPITPTIVTIVSILLRIGACAAFSRQQLPLGSLLYIAGLTLDGVDGKLARLSGRSSELGRRLDFSSDFGLFVALWLTLGESTGLPNVVLWTGVAAGIASAFATVMAAKTADPRAITTDRRQLVSAPGVLELHAVTFGVAPVVGITAVEICMVIATAYFLFAWLMKLRG